MFALDPQTCLITPKIKLILTKLHTNQVQSPAKNHRYKSDKKSTSDHECERALQLKVNSEQRCVAK